MMSEKIRPHHLERKAILYVRQSSPHQVLHNRESSALQYAMRDRRNNGDVAWRRPSYATIHRIVDNPIYGGAYAYGKTRVATGYEGSGVRVKSRRKPRGEWLALRPGAHEGYYRALRPAPMR